MSRWLVLPLVVLSYFATAASGAAPRDRDHDRLPDRWEKRYGLSTVDRSAKRDPDHDGLRNLREYRLRTNPRRKDTDGDGLRDGAEVRRYHTNPRRKDTDGDGYSDRVEVLAGTNPRKRNKHPSGNPPPSKPAPGLRPTGNNCMDDPSVCGFPDIENTGLTVPESSLATVSGNVTLATAGQIYENKKVDGCITVEAPNVVIRNVKVEHWCIFSVRTMDGASVTVEDAEIDFGGNPYNFMFSGSNITIRRVFMHNGSDCGAMGSNFLVEDSLCTLGPDTDDDGWSDVGAGFCEPNEPDPPHWDGFQSFRGSNQKLIHNTVRNPFGRRARSASARTRAGCRMSRSATTCSRAAATPCTATATSARTRRTSTSSATASRGRCTRTAATGARRTTATWSTRGPGTSGTRTSSGDRLATQQWCSSSRDCRKSFGAFRPGGHIRSGEHRCGSGWSSSFARRSALEVRKGNQDSWSSPVTMQTIAASAWTLAAEARGRPSRIRAIPEADRLAEPDGLNAAPDRVADTSWRWTPQAETALGLSVLTERATGRELN